MKLDTHTMDVQAAVADGTALSIPLYSGGTVQVHGTFSATLQVQGKIAPASDWVNIGGALTAPGLVNLADSNGSPYALTNIRVRTTAYTSGTPQAVFAGFNSRSDV
jgi:hypothetical protein